MPIQLLLKKLSSMGDSNAITDIPNLKFEKFSFRLLRPATSSGEGCANDESRSDR
jgi:hypothetical protein